MDGTLIDSMPLWKNYVTKYIEEKNLKLRHNPDVERDCRHMHIEEVAAYLSSHYPGYSTPEIRLEEMLAEIKQKYEFGYEHRDINVKPFIGKNFALLKSLKAAGIPMAVATATHRPIAEMILELTGLLPYFDAVLTTAEVGAGKEKPDVYFEAVHVLGGDVTAMSSRWQPWRKPSKAIGTCAVFEDAYICARTAKKAGFYTIVVEDSAARDKADKLRKLADLYVPNGHTVKFENGEFKMNKRDFHYDMPEELIAQTPLRYRDRSRMLCVSKSSDEFKHRQFMSLPYLLDPKDLLVFNDTKVIPARMHGKTYNRADRDYKETKCEILLLKQLTMDELTCTWECMVFPGRVLVPGTSAMIMGNLSAHVLETLPGGNRVIRFTCLRGPMTYALWLAGEMPVPPYIKRELHDREAYNTVYAKNIGSAAAPTAGLHFSHRVFFDLEALGTDTAYVTLHVGAGTFRPVKTENIDDHFMHKESYHVPLETIEKIAACKKRGGRVIAVGTTTVRTLESVNLENADSDLSGETDIFIRPGYEFKVVDGLVTNFHLPESTLIMLVSAFCTREKTLAAYEEAIREKYRFYSFGDAMLILDKFNDMFDADEEEFFYQSHRREYERYNKV